MLGLGTTTMPRSNKMTLAEMANISGILFLAGLAALVVCFFVPSLAGLGIRPRTPSGLLGIVFMPFLHGSWQHLTANATALLGLGVALMFLEGRKAIIPVLGIVLFGGLGTWLIGRAGSVHIGASGVVYGLIGYLLASGWFRKRPAYLVVALIVFFMYGSALWGVLPTDPCVSWEAHLCGFLAGGLEAKYAAETRKDAA